MTFTAYWQKRVWCNGGSPEAGQNLATVLLRGRAVPSQGSHGWSFSEPRKAVINAAEHRAILLAAHELSH